MWTPTWPVPFTSPLQVKGRIACELDAGDELLVTEMIVAGVFNDLTPQQVACCSYHGAVSLLFPVWCFTFV